MPKLSGVWQSSTVAPPEPTLVIPAGGPDRSAPKSTETDLAGIEAQIATLRASHLRRETQCGPRVYRHPDGSLQDHPPPRNPYTVANRKQWHVLATYCRTKGNADRDAVTKGFSVRHGVGVSYPQYMSALQALGQKPEFDYQGVWDGHTLDYLSPLDDPEHVFNVPGPFADLAADGVFTSLVKAPAPAY